MDLVTQIQNYVSTINNVLADTLVEIQTSSERISVSDPSFDDAAVRAKAERVMKLVAEGM